MAKNVVATGTYLHRVSKCQEEPEPETDDGLQWELGRLDN